MECTQINQLQTFANSDSGAAGEHIATEAVLWECSVTATREGLPFGAIETASNTDSESSVVATETMG